MPESPYYDEERVARELRHLVSTARATSQLLASKTALCWLTGKPSSTSKSKRAEAVRALIKEGIAAAEAPDGLSNCYDLTEQNLQAALGYLVWLGTTGWSITERRSLAMLKLGYCLVLQG